MPQNDISLVISAPSGAGKTTIIKQLLEKDASLQFSVSTTTRPRRDGEVDGKCYHFINTERFEKMIEDDEFIEWAEVHGNYYGTTKKEVDRILQTGHTPIFDVDIQGTKALKKNLSDGVFVLIVPPSLNVLEQRLRDRKTESEDQIRIRLQNASEEIKNYKLFDYIVKNTTVDAALNNIEAIISAEKCRINRNLDLIKTLEATSDYPS
jgi:guanylate kinase